jgi:hypothetical protein
MRFAGRATISANMPNSGRAAFLRPAEALADDSSDRCGNRNSDPETG